MMAVIAGILTAAMTMQYGYGELPCPLCLLQRVALFGVCLGIIQSFRHGFSYQNTGVSLVFTIFLLIVSVRQTLLDIYPRPGHEYIGTEVFGIHMPVWSIVIAVCILTAYALKLTALGSNDHLSDVQPAQYPVLSKIAGLVGLYVVVIAVINTVSVFVQCGLNQCHTFNYQLLQ
ncbi:MAG: disulfide bond formation protein B [Hyphomicrobiaceae bacterium]|nr:disulfide bond formation protein B [Hyphomicrobiaceae bacterium]